jgi:hypothetical protein
MNMPSEGGVGVATNAGGPSPRGSEPTARSRPEVAGEGSPTTKHDPVPRLILAAILLVITLMFIVVLASLPLTNEDTYFHLRFGDEFRHGHWSLWDPGTVSTFATQSWIPTQWLPEVVMAQVYDWFGLAGVAWFSGLQQVLLVTTLYLMARRFAEPVIVAALLVPTVAACSVGLYARPQVLSYVFVALTVGAWLRTREDGRLRWWLIPMTWLWAMCHGMWPVGIGLGVVAIVGIALDRAADRRTVLRALLVPAGSAVAAAVTPLGPALYGAVVGVGDRARFFSEWQTPDYHHVPSAQALAVCLLITVLLMLRAGQRSWTHTLFLLVAVGGALQSYRTIPVAAILLFFLATAAGQSLLASQAMRVRRPEVVAITAVAAGALIVLALMVPQTADDPPALGAWVDPALSALPSGTPVLTSMEGGSYLMWAHPQLDLLMHGYGDTFTIPELERNNDILKLERGWVSELRDTGIEVAVLEPDSDLAYALSHQEGWQVEHRSSELELLRAPSDW